MNILAVAGPNADYTIKFYDETGAPLMYMTNGTMQQFGLQGTADDSGVIGSDWDLTFPDATTCTNDTVRGDFFEQHHG